MHKEFVRLAPDDPFEGPNRLGRKARDDDDLKDWPWGPMVHKWRVPDDAPDVPLRQAEADRCT